MATAAAADTGSTLWLITGASRGLGAALTAAALGRGDRVVGFARSAAPSLPGLRWQPCDLSRLDDFAARFDEALAAALDRPFQRYVLVNNAGRLGPIGRHFEAEAVGHGLLVNLGAAMLASRQFADRLSTTPAAKRVVMISSGAAVRAIEGWSLYCAAKAGLEHFTRCFAAEQARLEHPCDVVCVRPGVIDTPMQAEIRAASATEFPESARFHALYESGALASADMVAAAILRGVDRGQSFAGQTMDLTNFAGTG